MQKIFEKILKNMFFQFSHIFLKSKQLEICPMGNIVGPGSTFLPVPILGGYRD
jgi:hypothetical protein